MTSSILSNPTQDKEESRITKLPNEVISLVISHMIGPAVYPSCDLRFDYDHGHTVWTPEISLSQSSIFNLAQIVLPKSNIPFINTEFDRLTWEQSWKIFTSPLDLINYRLLLRPQRWINGLNPAVQKSFSEAYISLDHVPTLEPSLTIGDEKIILDFSAMHYFAVFRVTVPPFELQEAYNVDTEICGAGSFLRHANHVVLRFGDAYDYANPWYNILDSRWEVDRMDASGRVDTPRFRPDVCSKGMVIDWILSYAWYHGFLQPVPKIELEGNIQPWVLEKWEKIFSEKRINKDFVHNVDVMAMETLGFTAGSPLSWDPSDHYPPRCTCEVICSKLGVELTWSGPARWDDFEAGSPDPDPSWADEDYIAETRDRRARENGVENHHAVDEDRWPDIW